MPLPATSTSAPAPAPACPDRPSPRSRPRPAGVALVVVLLAVVLLAGLLAFVLNLGHQVNARTTTQHAADSAAAAGATWIARSLNTVAMNNTGMAQLIAGVNVLDSMPLAVDFSIKDDSELILGDETALYLAVIHQLRLGGNEPVWQRELTRTRDTIGAPETLNPGTDEKMLKELNDWFKDQPEVVMNATFYLAPGGGNGSMWRAMFSLDEFSQTVMENLGPLAQINAVRGGEINLPDPDARTSDAPGYTTRSAALMLPVLPELPWVRRQFNDFERPVKQGLLPRDVDDKTTHRGPWDAVFGWRIFDNGDAGGATVGDPPGWRPRRTGDPDGYTTFGTHEWLRRFFDNTAYGRLPYHLRRISDIKLSYLWPKRNDSTPDTLEYLVEPNWEVDVETDNERSTYAALSGYENGDPDEERLMLDSSKNEVPLSDGDGGRVNRTVYEFARNQRRAIHETLFLTLTLWHRDRNENFDESRQYGKSANPTWWMRWGRTRSHYFRNGWRDPQNNSPFRLNPFGPIQAVDRDGNPVPPMAPQGYNPFYEYRATHSGRYAWKEISEAWTDPNVCCGRYADGGFPEIGISPVQVGTDSYGEPIYKSQQYWRTQYILLAGVNVGLERVIRDPYTGFNPNSASAPAPVDLDHPRLRPDDTDAKRRHLTILAVAQRDDLPATWRGLFDGNKPHPYMVGVAQAQLFNDHSWDLWTQMWNAQLQPVTRFDDWVDQMNSGAGDVGQVDLLSQDTYDNLRRYLEVVEPLADEMLRH